MDRAALMGLLVATLGGAAIGVERQWSGHASGAGARFGGFRTFTLLGGVAGLAGWLSTGELRPFSIALFIGATALIVAGYVVASRVDVDGTTEMAALVVLVAGALAGTGRLAVASGSVAVTALLLLEKTRLHALVGRIDDASLRASARFAAMACVILPLLPAGPYGPLDAIRPRELWALVLFFSGLSFAGWIARRVIGAGQGVIVAGLLGGAVSSTATTLQCARDSRTAGAPAVALAAGAVGACSVLLARVLIACAVLNPALAWAMVLPLLPTFLLGAAVVAALWRHRGDDRAAPNIEASPLGLRAALQMTAMFQLVLFAIVAVQMRWGSGALAATAVFVGLTDLDALTLSLARTATGADTGAAATALLAGIVANTGLKLGVALVIGRGAFRRTTALALGGMALATVAALLIQIR